jgi:pimeloyl-ACP methyl ester carboxylesterase
LVRLGRRNAEENNNVVRAAADAFHLVIPSLPGYGFSEKPTATGWDTIRVARASLVART